MVKITIITAYYNRPKEFAKLNMSLFKAVANKLKYDVTHFVIDDCSEKEIDNVSMLDHYRVLCFRQEKHMGKVGYWLTLNNILSAARESDCDFVIFLPDDEVVCPDFFSVVSKLFSKLHEDSMLQFLIDERITEGLNGFPYQIIDGTCMIPRHIMDSIDWRVENPHTEPGAPSSGVWRQLTERILKANPHARIHTPDHSVVFHLCPDTSVMHPKIRGMTTINAHNFYTGKGPIGIIDRYRGLTPSQDIMRYVLVVGGGIGNHIMAVALYLQLVKIFPYLDVVVCDAHYDRKGEYFYPVVAGYFGNHVYSSDQVDHPYDGQFVTAWGSPLSGVPVKLTYDPKEVNEVRRNNINAVRAGYSSNNWNSHLLFIKEVLPVPWVKFRGKGFNNSLHEYDVVICDGGFNESIWLKKKYQRWPEVVATLKAQGYTVASVGSDDQHIQGTDDMTHLSLIDTFDLIAKAKSFGGNCSGLSHFACAIGKDMVYVVTFTSKNKNIEGEGFHCTAQVVNPEVCPHQPGQKDDWSRKRHCEECPDAICGQFEPTRIIKAFKRILGPCEETFIHYGDPARLKGLPTDPDAYSIGG